MFHCFPGSGSLTRSTINQQAGGAHAMVRRDRGRGRRPDRRPVRTVRLLHSQVGPGRHSDAFGLAAGRSAAVGLLPAHDAIRRLDCHPDGHLGRRRLGRVLRADRRVPVVRALCAAGSTRANYRIGDTPERVVANGTTRIFPAAAFAFTAWRAKSSSGQRPSWKSSSMQLPTVREGVRVVVLRLKRARIRTPCA